MDGDNAVGEAVAWGKRRAADGKRKKHRTLRVMRLKGYLPLGRGVTANSCRSNFHRVNPNIFAFEVDVSRLEGRERPDASGGRSWKSTPWGSRSRASGEKELKGRYVFITNEKAEADAWLHAIQRQCEPAEERGAVAVE